MDKIFFIKLLVICLPFAAYFGIPTFILYKSGELSSYAELTEQHNTTKNAYVALAYSDGQKYMKLHSTVFRRPKVLALGTSRVYQLRDFFFNRPSDFYNAGGGASGIRHYFYFLNRLPEDYKPEVLIVSLDQNFFNSKWDNLNNHDFNNVYNDKFSLTSYVFSSSTLLWKDIIRGKVNVLVALTKPKHVGISSKVRDEGFRYDGSYYYGTRLPNMTSDEHLQDAINRIAHGAGRFQYQDHVNHRALAELDSFLSYCHRQQIHVVGFLPPFAHAVFEKIKASGRYGYIDELQNTLPDQFGNFGFSFFNFSDVHYYHSSDRETIDGFHVSETSMARITLEMANKDAKLRSFTDTSRLKKLIRNADSPLALFEEKQYSEIGDEF